MELDEGVGELLVRANGLLRAPIGKPVLRQLLSFAQLIHKWNKTYNLTAIQSLDDIVRKHIIEVLFALQTIDLSGKRILDVGSGAGIPGLVFAIVSPSSKVVCVDAAQKKASFIQHAIGVLKLENAQARHERIEKMDAMAADIITCRAFSNLHDFVSLTIHHLANNGCWVALKGQILEKETSQLPNNVELFHVEHIKIPDYLLSNADYRTVVFLRRRQN